MKANCGMYKRKEITMGDSRMARRSLVHWCSEGANGKYGGVLGFARRMAGVFHYDGPISSV